MALSPLDRFVYRAQQLALLANTAVIHETAAFVTRQTRPKVTHTQWALLKARYQALQAAELQNVAEGWYPRRLLFAVPVVDYVKNCTRLLADGKHILQRKRARDFTQVPPEAADYPPYYRRTFHWQTDGYLTTRSAELYDVGVELLFRGTADVMRRQVIPPIARFQRERGEAPLRVLDVACGTGRTLAMLSAALPGAELQGLDLSPAYVAFAAQKLGGRASVQVGNAEAIPLADASVDVVTCTYLFHELPRAVRRKVLAEMLRVLVPGGLLVLADSIQLSCSAELASLMHHFAAEYHEPFYEEYLTDDLAALVAGGGFGDVVARPQLISKVVVAHKPPRRYN